MSTDFVLWVKCTIIWLNIGLRVYLDLYMPDSPKNIFKYFSPNRPTGPIWSRSRDARVLLLSPSHAILPGEQRRSLGSKAISYQASVPWKNVPSLQLSVSAHAGICLMIFTEYWVLAMTWYIWIFVKKCCSKTLISRGISLWVIPHTEYRPTSWGVRIVALIHFF